MNEKRHIAGLQGNRSGADFERSLDISHAAYREHGLADVRRLPEPTRPLRDGRTRVLIARQMYDYFGVFGPNSGPKDKPGAWHGVAIGMEAKSTNKRVGTLRVGDDGAGVKRHQLAALAAAYESWGVISALVWRNGDQVLLMTPDRLAKAYQPDANRHPSLKASDFIAVDTAKYPCGRQVIDWLFPLRQWLEDVGRPEAAASNLRRWS